MIQLRNCRAEGYGQDVHSLPGSKSEAAAIGSPYFFTGKPCSQGHVAPRYTKGGSCTLCTRTKNARRVGAPAASIGKRARANIARVAAANAKELTYVPPEPCKHGHRLRWVASNNCVECDAAARAKRKAQIRRYRLEKLYGLAEADFAALAERQNNSCAICRKHVTDPSHFHVDHCHASGRVRGLLCGRCNQGIGLFREDPEIMQNAARYVQNA